MKSNLLFDFTVDKPTCTIYINRQFQAEQKRVWDAFTKKEILDQWWAPQPWKSKTKYMNFEVGGRRFYAMISPEGEEYWGVQDFTAISPIHNFQFVDGFSDKDENINNQMPSAKWNLDFSEDIEVTTVNITIKHKKLEDLEMQIQMGFKEGFTMTLNYLEELINKQKNNK
ncbi:SRPBCC domain-containing protein [Pseudozobellia sp. WGM2]|uniref:SRPBCC family protein n=1 Tax=Pseudozobellia sp. WGM2 TaxID=2787625 RepID=UPI001AE0693F|nr:SRPBCC domain-containing protein [Pseudozobellia sp. WGM2]